MKTKLIENTGNSLFHKEVLLSLARGVPLALRTFDRKTGRFLASNGGWAVTNQDIIYPLALLYKTPGNRYYCDRKILAVCGKGGDAWCNFQNPDGSFEFVKIDGSRWGKTFMPWSIYHWLETFILLENSLDEQCRARWRDGLLRAYSGLAGIRKNPSLHNIPTWDGMSLTRAGIFFNRPDWLELGRNQCRFSASHQHPNGFWPEGDGPTTSYNFVYMHALGLYYAFTEDKEILPALKRGTDFHTAFVYPDMTSIETIDGRVRYHLKPLTRGWPAFSLFPKGRRLIRNIFSHLPQCSGLDPSLASAFQYMCAGSEEPLMQEQKCARVVYGRNALLRKQNDWFFCVSGYSANPSCRLIHSRNRWIKTRSNCLSVWHKNTGLLIGGGNSKNDPLFATFEVWEKGAMRLEPDSVFFANKNGMETVRFKFGGLFCFMHIKPLNSKKLEIVFEVPPSTAKSASVKACFSLRLKAGAKIIWAADATPKVYREETVDPLRSIGVYWDPQGGYRNRMLRSLNWKIKMPEESAFEYPVYPMNPYAIDNHAPPEDCVGALTCGFLNGRVRKFILTIR